MLEAHDQHPVRMSCASNTANRSLHRWSVGRPSPGTNPIRRLAELGESNRIVPRWYARCRHGGEYPFRVGLCRQRRHPPGALLRTLVAP
jgi:hypothetical protein